MIVRFAFTKPEFEAAMRTMLRGLLVHRLLVAAGVALIALGVVFLILGGDDHALITPGILLLAYVGVVLFAMPKWRWRSARAVHGEQRYTFDESGMTFATPLSETKLAWGYFAGLVESGRFYFFKSRRRMCNPIPRRAFADTDEERFRSLAANRIKTRLRTDGRT